MSSSSSSTSTMPPTRVTRARAACCQTYGGGVLRGAAMLSRSSFRLIECFIAKSVIPAFVLKEAIHADFSDKYSIRKRLFHVSSLPKTICAVPRETSADEQHKRDICAVLKIQNETNHGTHRLAVGLTRSLAQERNSAVGLNILCVERCFREQENWPALSTNGDVASNRDKNHEKQRYRKLHTFMES